jgi:hypothetical protein
MRCAVAAVFLSLSLSAPAQGQDWKQSYESGDYFRALSILQPLVFESWFPQEPVDPLAPLYLSSFYANGWSVERDPVIACALVTHSHRMTMMKSFYPQAVKDAIMALVEKTCSVLSSEAAAAALAISTCPNHGLAGQSLQLSNGWIEITHSKLIVDAAGKRNEWPRDESIGTLCAQHVLPIQVTQLRSPDGARTRQILQVFMWLSTRPNGEKWRALEWRTYEVVAGSVELMGGEILVGEPGSAWPVRPVPDGASPRLRFNAAGEMEYTVTHPGGQRKTVMMMPHEHVLKKALARVQALGARR